MYMLQDAFWALVSLFERSKYLAGFYDNSLSKLVNIEHVVWCVYIILYCMYMYMYIHDRLPEHFQQSPMYNIHLQRFPKLKISSSNFGEYC